VSGHAAPVYTVALVGDATFRGKAVNASGQVDGDRTRRHRLRRPKHQRRRARRRLQQPHRPDLPAGQVMEPLLVLATGLAGMIAMWRRRT
jgi:hypothetical protein